MTSSRHSVLVTGATGFLGRQIVTLLAQDNTLDVIAGSRGGQSVVGKPGFAYGDLADLRDLTADLQGIDAVVHCAALAHVLREPDGDPLPRYMAVNCDATLDLARQAAAAGVQRFIFISSIGVNGNQTYGTPFRPDDPPAPHAPYAVSKLAAEEGLRKIARDTGLEVVILRLPLVLGPDPVGNLASLSRLIGKGVPLPFGLATGNRRSLVTAPTVARAIRDCLHNPQAIGQVFLVADTPPLHLRGILTTLADLTGQRLKLVPVPVWLLRGMLRLAGKGKAADQLFGDLEIDSSHLRRRLGWTDGPDTEQD